MARRSAAADLGFAAVESGDLGQALGGDGRAVAVEDLLQLAPGMLMHRDRRAFG